MTIVSPWFVLLALAGALLARRVETPADVLAVVSLAFFVCAMPTVGAAIALIGLAATGLAVLRAVQRWKNPILLAAGITLILGEFLVAKHLLPNGVWHPGLAASGALGLSYVMFRVIHLLVDAHGDELPDGVPAKTYACYLFSHLTLLAGPIQRFQDFAAQLSAPDSRRSHSDLTTAVPLVIFGYFRFAVVAAGFFLVFGLALRAAFADGPAALRILALAASGLGFTGYLYFSFAGYTDVVRGFGLMTGLALPANFDRPFASRDFLELWSRWHITLSEWFKIYVFNPTVKELISATARPRLAPYLAAVGYLVTFFLMGLWHGTTSRFILYGLCLGAGASATKLFQTLLNARLGKARYRTLAQSPVYGAMARASALTYFVLALAFFWVPADPIVGWTVWAAVLEGAIAAALVLALIGLVVWGADRLRLMACRLDAWRPPPAASAGAALLAVLIVVLGFPEAVPPLLYQLF